MKTKAFFYGLIFLMMIISRFLWTDLSLVQKKIYLIIGTIVLILFIYFTIIKKKIKDG